MDVWTSIFAPVFMGEVRCSNDGSVAIAAERFPGAPYLGPTERKMLDVTYVSIVRRVERPNYLMFFIRSSWLSRANLARTK